MLERLKEHPPGWTAVSAWWRRADAQGGLSEDVGRVHERLGRCKGSTGRTLVEVLESVSHIWEPDYDILSVPENEHRARRYTYLSKQYNLKNTTEHF